METGTKVTGEYCGIEFIGVVTDARPITVPTDGAIEHCVILDFPVQVFGLEKNRLLVTTKWNGQPSSYTRFSDKLQAI